MGFWSVVGDIAKAVAVTTIVAGAVVALISVVVLTLDTIQGWLQTHKTIDSKYAKLIKERLSNGKYKVISQIFNHCNQQTDSVGWEANSLADDVQQYFRGGDEIRIELA